MASWLHSLKGGTNGGDMIKLMVNTVKKQTALSHKLFKVEVKKGLSGAVKMVIFIFNFFCFYFRITTIFFLCCLLNCFCHRPVVSRRLNKCLTVFDVFKPVTTSLIISKKLMVNFCYWLCEYTWAK